jgi:CheY-like chemotaxis protein
MDGRSRMKLFVVDDKPLSLSIFLEAIKEKHWSHYSFAFAKKAVADEETLRRFLRAVCEEKPDIVLLDAALSRREDKRLDDLRVAGKEVSEDSLSGFKYCKALARERLGIPIVFLTVSSQGQVARMAMRVGADRVLVKDTKTAYLLREIEELVKTRTPHDAAFYWPIRDELDAGGLDMWQAHALGKALDRFYLSEASVRRFGLFTASLREILSPLFQGDVEAERKLVLGLMKSQVLLSLGDPRLRDHVKHTGNVFWLGYRLLNEIAELHEPPSRSGYASALYPGADISSMRDQLFYAWTLAALFHDYGYVNERQHQLAELVKSIIPGVTVTYKDVRDGESWTKNMRELREFVRRLHGHSHFLYHFIDCVMSCFGNEIESPSGDKKTPMLDHGFLSAHRLLGMVPLDRLDAPKRNIVLHAALAIACHNYVDMLRKWKFGQECCGRLSLADFPVCSLLAFCDSVQTWDREADVDPGVARTEAYDGLLERLVLSDTAYVSGSEIAEFAIVPMADSGGYSLTVGLRYFVTGVRGVEEVCDTLGQDIQRWIDLGRLRDVCDMTGVSSLLHGQISYELPMLAGTRKVTF